MELGSGFPTFDNANTALEALFFTALRWWFQVRFSSKTNSRELKDSFLQPVPILSISLFQIKSCFESPTRTYVFFLKSIYFVLVTFRVGLFVYYFWKFKAKSFRLLRVSEENWMFCQLRKVWLTILTYLQGHEWELRTELGLIMK